MWSTEGSSTVWWGRSWRRAEPAQGHLDKLHQSNLPEAVERPPVRFVGAPIDLVDGCSACCDQVYGLDNVDIGPVGPLGRLDDKGVDAKRGEDGRG